MTFERQHISLVSRGPLYKWQGDPPVLIFPTCIPSLRPSWWVSLLEKAGRRSPATFRSERSSVPWRHSGVSPLVCPHVSDRWWIQGRRGMTKCIIGIQTRPWDFLIFLLFLNFLFLYLYSHVVQPLQSLLILVQVVSLVVVPYLTFVIMK